MNIQSLSGSGSNLMDFVSAAFSSVRRAIAPDRPETSEDLEAGDPAQTHPRTAWEAIRQALGALTGGGQSVYATSLFNGAAAPAMVSGMTVRVANVAGGYSVLRSTVGLNAQTSTERFSSSPSFDAGRDVEDASSAERSNGAGDEKKDEPIAAQPADKSVSESVNQAARRQRAKLAYAASSAKGPEKSPEKSKDAVENPAVTVQEGTFTVNGASVAVAADDTIDTVLAKITASDAGVTATYVEETQTVTLTSTRLSTEPITVGADTSGFLAAVKLDDTATSVTATQTSPFDVALADMTEYSAVQAGAVTVNGHDIAVDPAETTVRKLVSTLNSFPDVSASLNDASGQVTIASLPGGAIALSDTSGVLASLGIEPGTHHGSGATIVAAQTRAETAAVSEPKQVAGQGSSLPVDGVPKSVSVDPAPAQAATVDPKAQQPRAAFGRRVQGRRQSAQKAASIDARLAAGRHASPRPPAAPVSLPSRMEVSSAAPRDASPADGRVLAGLFDRVLNRRTHDEFHANEARPSRHRR